jgi:hypothetical protein
MGAASPSLRRHPHDDDSNVRGEARECSRGWGGFGRAVCGVRSAALSQPRQRHGQTYEETLAVFERNLDRIEFRTPRGRALAEEGRGYARDFIARLGDDLAS